MDKMDSARVRVLKSARDYVCSDPEVLSLEWNGREIRNCKALFVTLTRDSGESRLTRSYGEISTPDRIISRRIPGRE